VEGAGDEEDSVRIGQLLLAKPGPRKAARAAKLGRQSGDERPQGRLDLEPPPPPLSNFSVAAVSRSASATAAYGNLGGAGDDDNIELRDTVVQNPLGISGSSFLWTHRRVDSAEEEDEEVVVFTGRYG